MNLKEVLAQLAALGNEKMRAQNRKHGAGANQFGVRLGIYRDYPLSKGCTSPFVPLQSFRSRKRSVAATS